MSSNETHDVAVRPDPDGTIVVGADPVGAAGICVIALDCGVLSVDPMSPDIPPQLRVTEGAELDTVAALYGLNVARAVLVCDETTIECSATPSVDRDRLVRLGVLRWIGIRAPVALDIPVLTVEEYSTAALVSNFLDPDHNHLQALTAWTDSLVTWSERARHLDSPFRRPPVVMAMLKQALATVESMLSAGDASRAAVRHEAELLEAMSVFDLNAVDPDTAWRFLQDLQPEPAQTLATGDVSSWQGEGSVDWDRTPASSTGRGEKAVSWRISQQAHGGLLTVLVAAPPPSPHDTLLQTPGQPRPATPQLQATLYASDWPMPLAVADLGLRSETGSWMGVQELAPSVMDQLAQAGKSPPTVDVHSTGQIHQPQSRHRTSQAATRWAARGLTGLRLASAADDDGKRDLGIAARAALTLSATLYRTIPTEHATRAAAMCQLLADQSTTQEGDAVPRTFWRGAETGAAENTRRLRPLDPPAQVSAAEAWFVADAPRLSLDLS